MEYKPRGISPSKSSGDWGDLIDDIIEEFNLIEEYNKDWRVVSNEEITKEQFNESIANINKKDTVFYIPERSSVFIQLCLDCLVLGIKLPEKYQESMGEHADSCIEIRNTVLSGINNKKITPSFVKAWGQYQFSAGTIFAYYWTGYFQKHFSRNIKKNIPLHEQKHIYAYWMHYYWINGDGLSREEVEENLIAAILEAIKMKKVHLSDKTTVDSMLNSGNLKTTYTNMLKKDIIRIATNKSIPPSDLPIINHLN